ncbi:hypothetical protein RB653_002173 [Dictyostelium firmibasis]|uniref:DNA topoisomerase n=1 Tax=Dictyostelium firmibasis TaxID=79012 RepID=A0AAN7U866_9MYCE
MTKRILNVAEKPSAAKEISAILSNKRATVREGFSKYNKLWDFKYNILNFNDCEMIFTSVTGHLMEIDVVEQFKPWASCDPIQLFEAPIRKSVPSDKEPLKKTLEREIKKADILILWLDCDREGENIAFEVLEVCKGAKKRFEFYRAHFSAIIPREIDRACKNLVKPNEKDSIAVDTRMEIDLRIGAAFTRFQTLYLKKFKISSNSNDRPPPASRPNGHGGGILSSNNSSGGKEIISYGPCQFPTLGFVVERYFRIVNFKPEDFWSLSVIHEKSDSGKKIPVTFSWCRKRLFDYTSAFILYEKCLDNTEATVVDVTSKESRYRPVPLTTIELQKAASKKLRISSAQTMQLAEELYTKGFISYPRTETDSFQAGTDLKGLISNQSTNPEWGAYASRLVNNNEFVYPKSGKNNDNSHPPIHPTSAATGLTGNSKKIYDFITRRFLACCSEESVFANTTVTIDIEGEGFSETGTMVLKLGYLEVYPFDKRNDKLIPTYQKGERFTPKRIDLTKGTTMAPHYITEAELLTAMDTNKIGTDATMATHIQTIQDRLYVTKNESNQFVPSHLGVSLVASYELMGFEFSKPNLRAAIEADVDKISRGQKTKQDVLQSTIEKYKQLYQLANQNTDCFDRSFREFYEPADPKGGEFRVLVPQFSRCGKCNGRMQYKSDQNQETPKRILFCPQCIDTFDLPIKGDISQLVTTTGTPQICPICKYQVLSVKNPVNDQSYTICPKCRSFPPNSTHKKPFHCFQCTFTCNLATGNRQQQQQQQQPLQQTNYNNNNNSRPTTTRTTRTTNTTQRRTFTASNNNFNNNNSRNPDRNFIF